MTTAPDASRARMISSASRRLRHIGFSTSTCTPRSRAATAHSAWYSSLFRISTASSRSCSSISDAFWYRAGTPYRSPITRSSVGEMSQIAPTSNRSGSDSRIGRCTTCATSPRPMTPTRSLLTSVPHLRGRGNACWMVGKHRDRGLAGGSALGRAGDQPAGQGPLEQEEEDQHGQGRQGAGGHDVAPLSRELLDEAVQAEAQGELARRGQE